LSGIFPVPIKTICGLRVGETSQFRTSGLLQSGWRSGVTKPTVEER
jgi:hypothetical protein